LRFKSERRWHASGGRTSLFGGLSLAVALMRPGTAHAQVQTPPCPDCSLRPLAGRDIGNALCAGADGVDTGSTSPTPRILLFRMLPGFLSEPPGLAAFDDPSDEATSSAKADSNPDGFVLSFGDDNPYFAARRPGDPGGVGFIHIHSQLQVVDWGYTSVCVGMRAWTPAGLENGGVQNGQTVISPGIGVFQDLGAGSALHAFVDQSMVSGGYHPGPMRCGMALDCPVPVETDATNRSLFFVVQALGQYDFPTDRHGRSMNCQVVPGLHWRVSDAFWLSLGASRLSTLTCGWHF
jgi:hypothetical protein